MKKFRPIELILRPVIACIAMLIATKVVFAIEPRLPGGLLFRMLFAGVLAAVIAVLGFWVLRAAIRNK